jgi:hypothetical protein
MDDSENAANTPVRAVYRVQDHMEAVNPAVDGFGEIPFNDFTIEYAIFVMAVSVFIVV